jgi:hypothetical protein
MKRYKKLSDAVPHETNVLVVSGTDRVFGDSFESLFDEVRRGLLCDKLYVEENYYDLADLGDHASLIQHAVWVVHQSVLLGRNAHVEYYLETGFYPDETQVILCVDADRDTEQAVRQQYGDRFPILTDRDQLQNYLLGSLNAINPCTLSGLEYIYRWNNAVCDALGEL